MNTTQTVYQFQSANLFYIVRNLDNELKAFWKNPNSTDLLEKDLAFKNLVVSEDYENAILFINTSLFMLTESSHGHVFLTQEDAERLTYVRDIIAGYS
jgi:hypothetical protein